MKSIELGEVTVHNLKQLKKLNQIVFPVSYNDKFYKDVLDVGPLAKLGIYLMFWTLLILNDLVLNHFFVLSLPYKAYFNDIVVGGVCCRIDLSESKRRLYIMTLGCLSAYRRLGIGKYKKKTNFYSISNIFYLK